MSTKNVSLIGRAVWPAIGNIYTNVLFYYLDEEETDPCTVLYMKYLKGWFHERQTYFLIFLNPDESSQEFIFEYLLKGISKQRLIISSQI